MRSSWPRVVRGSFVYVFLCTSFFKLPCTGQDATEAFEDVGHSDEARALLQDMCIGELEVEEVGTTHRFVIYALLFSLLQGIKLKSAAAEAQSIRVANSAVEHGSK